MKTGIRWLNVVLLLGEQTMITSLLLGVQTPIANTKFHANGPGRDAGHRAAEHVPDDTAGSPILFVNDEILATFDQAVETGSLTVEDRTASFDETRESDNDADGEDPDDDDIDWSQPMFVRGTNDESFRELRLHADDPNEIDRMHAAGIFGGSSGGLAPTTSGGMIDLMRHREPIETVDFYVL